MKTAIKKGKNDLSKDPGMVNIGTLKIEKMRIKDFLWDDATGLPDSFAPDEVEEKTDAVFKHLLISSRSGALSMDVG